MPITIRGASGASTSATSFQIAETSGGNPQSGDDRFAFVTTATTNSITFPAGWTVLYNAVITNVATVAIAYKTYVPGGGTEIVTLGTNGYYGVQLISIAGRSTTASIQQTVAGTATASTSLVSQSLTPATNDGLLLVWFAQTRQSAGTSATLTVPSGLTQADYRAPANAIGYPILLASRALTSTAATGTYTSTANASGIYRTATLYIPAGPVVTQSSPRSFAPFFGAF